MLLVELETDLSLSFGLTSDIHYRVFEGKYFRAAELSILHHSPIISQFRLQRTLLNDEGLITPSCS